MRQLATHLLQRLFPLLSTSTQCSYLSGQRRFFLRCCCCCAGGRSGLSLKLLDAALCGSEQRGRRSRLSRGGSLAGLEIALGRRELLALSLQLSFARGPLLPGAPQLCELVGEDRLVRPQQLVLGAVLRNLVFELADPDLPTNSKDHSDAKSCSKMAVDDDRRF